MNHRPPVGYSDYFVNLMQSLLLHTVAVGFLFLSMDTLSGQAQSQVGKMLPKPDIVQAVAVEEADVLAEVKRLEEADEQKQVIIQKAETAKQELKQLKASQEKMQLQEKQKLAQLKLQAEKERDTLKALQDKKEKQTKELQALNERKRHEQERLKKLQEKHQFEEKKRFDQEKVKETQAAAQKAKETEQAAAQKAKEAQAMLAAKQNLLNSEREKYMALVKQKIDNVWIRPGEAAEGLVCEIEIQVLPDGSVVSSKVVNSSGNFAFDRATEAAITRASPLPMPTDKELIRDFRHFKLSFRQPDHRG